MKKQRIKEGAILEISIEGEYYVYAQILTKGLGYAFFDYKSESKLLEFSILKDMNVLFVVMIYDNVVKNGIWEKVGNLEIRDDLKVLPMKFIQNVLDKSIFELYNPNTGEIIKATKEQCIGLERASVWAANHVEERIRDYYAGESNDIVKQFEIIN